MYSSEFSSGIEHPELSVLMTLGKPLPSSGVSGPPTKLSVSSMLSDDPSEPVEHAPVDGGLSGDE